MAHEWLMGLSHGLGWDIQYGIFNMGLWDYGLLNMGFG
jgi:hypothetical protein